MNSSWEIITKNLGTFKIWNGVKDNTQILSTVVMISIKKNKVIF